MNIPGKYKIYLGLIFSAVGTASLLFNKDVLMAAAWLSFGNGLLIAEVRLAKPNPETGLMPATHPARKYASVFLIGLACCLLALQVYQDISGQPQTENTEAKQ